MSKITIVSKRDLIIEWFSGNKKAGGQYLNRHNNCCRIRHPESGAVAQCTRHREAKTNQREAFLNLLETAAYKIWLARKLIEIRTGETIDERVQKSMESKNLIVETLKDGQWVKLEGGVDKIVPSLV